MISEEEAVPFILITAICFASPKLLPFRSLLKTLKPTQRIYKIERAFRDVGGVLHKFDGGFVLYAD